MTAIQSMEMAAVLIAKLSRLVMNVQYGANLAVKFVEMEC
jgi:hypothetical protein